MTTTPPPLTSFLLFPLLPTELRLKIWSAALSIPRTLTLYCERQIIEGESRRATRFSSNLPPPSLLGVCAESRCLALSTYTPSFTVPPTFTNPAGPNILYVSWALDTIRCSDRIIEYFSPADRESVQRLELEVSDASYFSHFHMETIRRMSSLHLLILETKPNDGYGWSGLSMDVLNKDFSLERETWLGWACPQTRVVEGRGGEVLVCIPGGAIVGGWREGDERPDLSGEEERRRLRLYM